MGKIVVSEFVTLDGVMQDPGGAEGEPGGWAFKFDRGPEGNQFKLEELRAAGALLLGRVTYEGFAQAWPAMNADEFGEKMNSMPKYVVSRTLSEAEWNNSTIISGDVAPEVRRLRDEVDGDVLINGSATLVHHLVEADLIDEYRLMIYPILLGRGKRIFADSGVSHHLQLAEQRRAGETAILILHPASRG